MSREVLVKVDSVSKKFCRSLSASLAYGLRDVAAELLGIRRQSGQLRPREFWAVENVSFELRRGECLGLVGHNGAGKTTLLKMLNGLIKPDRGQVTMRGRVGALIALGAGFNPILSGRENIYVSGSVLGLGRREIDDRFDEIVDFAGVREAIDAPVQTYSSGMQVRLGFSVATCVRPDVLILDEVLAVGDASFRAKCYKRMGEMSRECAVIVVSHDQSHLTRVCDRCIMLQHGAIVADGDPLTVLAKYNGATDRSGALRCEVQTGDAIRSVGVEVEGVDGGGRLKASDPLRVRVILESTEEVPLVVCMVNFMESGGEGAAQVDFSRDLSAVPRGRSMIVIDIPQLDLARGVYTINVELFGQGGSTVVHALNCASVEVLGRPFLWVAYKVPHRLEVLADTDRFRSI